ncbi:MULTISPECIES: hypothetical protein [Arthrobacter]|uniref:DUF4394 domain-containing protein n=1 Tax=Arthrobacter terricola TaxID=2547396 RepID=A0A4R5K7V4_9MICC|nr:MULTISPECIES: hypothetical protein [Arthrobacter]MBT8161721.1 hypothetical protein [Arthrobacter sp. GN70]TDF89405.1 hypothetical protein E1809_23085 [Arthrobacter terricola]
MKKTQLAGIVGVVLTAVGGAGTLAAAAPAAAAGSALHARVILDGKAHGWSSPDDATFIGPHIFVGFQNGVPSDGPAVGTPQQSTLVEMKPSGEIEQTWNITGKIDGMGADAANNRVILTVNEDSNSSMYTVDLGGAVQHYTYDEALPHGGGTDAVSVFHGAIYTSASNPSGGPALYRITLKDGGVAHVDTTAINTDSVASVANAGQSGSTQLALTDPDSNTVVPANAERFGGDFMLDAQGDQQAVFASSLAPNAPLQVLNLAQSVDDTTFATHSGGKLIVTDAHSDTVDIVDGHLVEGAAYAAVTPGNSNTPPVPTPANYLARLNLNDGSVTPLAILGTDVVPHGVIYMP